MELVKEKLPFSPAYYDKDMLTDKSMRFLVSEIIREKILLRYEKEIPYSTEVMVEEYLEGENLNRIRHGGEQIKKIGIEARKDIEEFTSKKCFLELFVKVKKDWRNSERDLQNFGYEQKK